MSPLVHDTERADRSMLFVPATQWPMIVKASTSAADAVCIDLEDSVPLDAKEASRETVIRALRELDFGGRTRMFRINALDTPFAYRDVIDVVEAAGGLVDRLMLPKARGPRDVEFLDTLLSQVEARCKVGRPIEVEAQIESAAGFVWVREIAQASRRLSALIFGAGDFAASMRMPASGIGTFDANDEIYPGHRWHAAMHAIVAAARANGLRCIDGPYSSYRDLEGFERACRIARTMGFDGKQCIHPAQLETVNRVFAPTAEELAHARRVIDAYEAGAASGRGAVSVDGRMVDEANVRMARVVLSRAGSA